MSIFHKNSEKGYNIWKKFHIGSVILMAQMTNQKKTELIDYFDPGGGLPYEEYMGVCHQLGSYFQ